MTDLADSPAVRRLDDWDLERLETLADEYDTPLYVMDCDRVKANYTRFSEAFPDAHVMYAAKAHTGKAVLEAVIEAGGTIECAAWGTAAIDRRRRGSQRTAVHRGQSAGSRPGLRR